MVLVCFFAEVGEFLNAFFLPLKEDAYRKQWAGCFLLGEGVACFCHSGSGDVLRVLHCSGLYSVGGFDYSEMP